jgi:hypothetical protein
VFFEAFNLCPFVTVRPSFTRIQSSIELNFCCFSLYVHNSFH